MCEIQSKNEINKKFVNSCALFIRKKEVINDKYCTSLTIVANIVLFKNLCLVY